MTDLKRYIIVPEVTLSVAGRFELTIPSSCTHLEGFLRIRSSEAVNFDPVKFYFNDDTSLAAGNYIYTRLARSNIVYTGYGAVDSTTNNEPIEAPGSSIAADHFATHEFKIMNYSLGTEKKYMYARGFMLNNVTSIRHNVGVLYWNHNDAITKITIQPNGYATDTFDIGSTAKIIGLVNE